MLRAIRSNRRVQLGLGLVTGLVFGFLLQKGGVTNYDVIVGQLLLTDFTVLKVMIAAVVTGMLGVHFLRSLGLVRLHPKPGSLGATLIGGLVFGAGFAILGYCPGTVAGAVGQGAADGLLGGVVGILIGVGWFAALYPRLQKLVLNKGDWGERTLPDVLGVNAWFVVIPAAVLLIASLIWLESIGR